MGHRWDMELWLTGLQTPGEPGGLLAVQSSRKTVAELRLFFVARCEVSFKMHAVAGSKKALFLMPSF